MIIKKLENNTLENQFIPHHANVWYDRHIKSWVVQLLDVYENQIGNAIYSYCKQDAISTKEQLEKQYMIERGFEGGD